MNKVEKCIEVIGTKFKVQRTEQYSKFSKSNVFFKATSKNMLWIDHLH